MSISKKQLLKLSNFPTASWALWSEKFNKRDSMESEPEKIYPFIISHYKKLKNNIVFVGLNRSKKRGGKETIKYPKFANFHSIGHPGDGFLKQMINNYPILTGAYMTDLSSVQESDSRKVKIENLNSFTEQLNILSSSVYNIICFGDEVIKNIANLAGHKETIAYEKHNDIKKIFIEHNDLKLNLYKIIHYSYAVRYNNKDRFRRQLNEIVKSISEEKKETGSG